jgi:hypothetical protein
MRGYITNKILSTFLLLQILFISIISRYPDWVEKYYAQGIYPYLSRFFRRILGWIPISIGDILYLLLLIIILRWLWILIRSGFSPLGQHLFQTGAFISIIFFSFHVFWGLNYYRQSLQHQLNINSLEYTHQELLETTKLHITKINKLHQSIVNNDSLAVIIPLKRNEIYKIAGKEYSNFNFRNLDFYFNSKSIKSSLLSNLLSYMGFSGYLNPFTGEAQVNKKIPKTNFPVTVCHEMAHQLGYASEEQANYIGYLACIKSDELYFQFSGELLAIQNLLYSLSLYDRELYIKNLENLHFGIRKNIQQNHDFWDSYQNPIEPYIKRFYDGYLKANNQESGIDSYNAMVGYLVKEKNKLGLIYN